VRAVFLMTRHDNTAEATGFMFAAPPGGTPGWEMPALCDGGERMTRSPGAELRSPNANALDPASASRQPCHLELCIHAARIPSAVYRLRAVFDAEPHSTLSLVDAAILCDLDQASCRAVLLAFQDAGAVEWLGESVRVCAGAPRVPALPQSR
jgi:hypothetical protein